MLFRIDPTAAEPIFAQLAAQVLSGDRTPGDTLPSERTRSEALGVSRPAVREALGRLDRGAPHPGPSGRLHGGP